MVLPANMNLFGAYVHIPFCIQRCHYCDFATYAKDQISPNDEYVEAVCKEIEMRRSFYQETHLDTIYFGGGTPSLLSPMQLGRIIDTYKKVGFTVDAKTEITIEVNPATLDPEKCRGLRDVGFNRVSIGCQSFHDPYLKACNREHTAEQTRSTIQLVKQHFNNFSLDLLFSLPKQGLSQLAKDLDEITGFQPPHVSAYCLTLPPKHPMNQGRGSEDEQVEMFEMVIQKLAESDLQRYELSNFSQPGFESTHNNLYWTDQNYWGVGLSAHSYRRQPQFGYRFWNPRSYSVYMEQMESLQVASDITTLPKEQRESLLLHESLTDFCHTHLRLARGLDLQSVRQKFGDWAPDLVLKKLADSQDRGWVASKSPTELHLTDQGFLLSNRVFEELLISSDDIDKVQTSPIF